MSRDNLSTKTQNPKFEFLEGSAHCALGGLKVENRVFLNGNAGSRYGFFIDFREVLGYLGVDLRAVSVATSGSAI